MTHEERLAKAVEFNRQFVASKKAAQIATRDLIKTDALAPEELEQLVSLYPGFAPGTAYKIGDVIQYGGALYKVIQAHTSQADWTPDSTPALFTAAAPAGTIPEFVQPTGAHDAYDTGDKVIFNGVVYESLVDGNAFSPTAYPPNWKAV